MLHVISYGRSHGRRWRVSQLELARVFWRGWCAGLEESGFNDQHEGSGDGHNDDDAVEQFPIYKSVEVVRCDKSNDNKGEIGRRSGYLGAADLSIERQNYKRN